MMSDAGTFLTVVVIKDAEKDDYLLEHFYSALRHLNDVTPDVQLITLTQKANDQAAVDIARESGLNVLTVESAVPRVDGYPVWDVMADMRQLRPFIDGEYVTVCHPEFIYPPDMLKSTVDWLKQNRPLLALGNLMRLGTREVMARRHKWWSENTREYSIPVETALATQNKRTVQRVLAGTEMTHWWFWVPKELAGLPGQWIEDVFFMSTAWMDASRFFHHGGEQPFQDIYDLMAAFTKTLVVKGLVPDCPRIPDTVSRQIHLWHSHPFHSWTEPMKQYFITNPKWLGTPYGCAAMWDKLIAYNNSTGRQRGANPNYLIRLVPGGTIARFKADAANWLNNGGQDALTKFHAERGGLYTLK